VDDSINLLLLVLVTIHANGECIVELWMEHQLGFSRAGYIEAYRVGATKRCWGAMAALVLLIRCQKPGIAQLVCHNGFRYILLVELLL
jgi:hypothetical protein